MPPATPSGMKLGHAALALGSFYLLLGAACGRRAEPVGTAETTGATVLPAETVRPAAAVGAPAAPAGPAVIAPADADLGRATVAPSSWSWSSSPSSPAVAAPVPTLAVPGIVEDRYPAGRGTLSVVAAPNLAANLGDAGAPAAEPAAASAPGRAVPDGPAPGPTDTEAPRPPSAADRQPWTGAAAGP